MRRVVTRIMQIVYRDQSGFVEDAGIFGPIVVVVDGDWHRFVVRNMVCPVGGHSDA